MFYLYPHTNLDQSNLDWMIKTLKEIQSRNTIKVITQASQMTDPSCIYIYQGTESGYITNSWWYYDTATREWTDGGIFGGNLDNLVVPDSLRAGLISGNTYAIVVDGNNVSFNGTAPAFMNGVTVNGPATFLGTIDAQRLNVNTFTPNSITTGSLNVSGTASLTHLNLAVPLSIDNGGTGGALGTFRSELGLGAGTGPLDIAHGGTGVTTAAEARTALGANNASNLTAGVLAITHGGTGATTAAGARDALGLNDASNISAGVLAVAYGGTGATTAAGARSAIGADNAGNIVQGQLAIAHGGTGAATAAGARDALGLTYAAGDVQRFELQTPFSGAAFTATTAIFHVDLPKSMENISSVTVTAMIGRILSTTGVVDSSTNDTNWATQENYTVSADIITSHTLRVRVAKTSGSFNYTASTPIIYCAQDLRLQFNA